jgi:hypothetical protein
VDDIQAQSRVGMQVMCLQLMRTLIVWVQYSRARANTQTCDLGVWCAMAKNSR